MWVLRLLIVLALIVPVSLCVQENANNVTSMSVFGWQLFSNVSTPIVVLVSVAAGMVLAIPVVALSRAARTRRKKKREEKIEKRQDNAKGSDLPANGGA